MDHMHPFFIVQIPGKVEVLDRDLVQFPLPSFERYLVDPGGSPRGSMETLGVVSSPVV